MLSSSGSLYAQDILVQNEPQVILPIGIRSWEGTAEELRRIESTPVPASYRARCDGLHDRYACEADLLAWHFNFGTARSAERALDHIAKSATNEYELSPRTAERYAALLPEALRNAEAYLAAEELTYDSFLKQDRSIGADRYPALVELNTLQGKLQKMGDIALLYARAANWYRSPLLLHAAMQWRGYLSASRATIAELSSPDSRRLLQRVAGFDEPEFLELSLAVTQAAIERNEESIRAANEASARAFDPAYRDRELGNGMNRWMAEQFRYYRFRILLLADELELDMSEHDGVYLGHYDFDDMENLSRPEEREMDSIHYLAFSERQRFAEVIIAQGEHDVRVTPARCREGNHFELEGLDILLNGGRVISPAHSPAPYRRIAQLYLDLYAIGQRCPDEEGGSVFEGSTQYGRQARLYRQFLDNYDELALGQ